MEICIFFFLADLRILNNRNTAIKTLIEPLIKTMSTWNKLSSFGF